MVQDRIGSKSESKEYGEAWFIDTGWHRHVLHRAGDCRGRTKLTTLHSFDGTDGYEPLAGLVQATDGNFYGTTFQGGTSNRCHPLLGCGTVFKITPGGTLTTLHSFDRTDGAGPQAALVQATNGNFYGTTTTDGANGDGTVFKITPGGVLTTLHSFDGIDGGYHMPN